MSQNTRRILTEGLFAGMLGYLVVVVVIATIDVISGRVRRSTRRPCSDPFSSSVSVTRHRSRSGLPVWFNAVIGRVLSLWSVVIATTAAAVALAACLWHAHPCLRREVTARSA